MPEISQILRKGVLCDLKDTVARKLLDRKYTLPALGIPMTDLSRDVRNAIANAGAVYDIVSSIPAWALKPNKPTYTAQEVGALPSSTVIPTVPTKLSAFINDVGYVTSFEETDPTVPQWAKQQTKPSYTASEVGALPSTTHIPADPVNADWNASSGLAQILNKPILFSGDYNDLRNKPVIPESVDLTGYATTDDVDAAIAALVSSAPQTLDTLKELADALGDDPNFATTVSTALGNKVDKVSGKALSSNDYTTADKNKLAGIAEGAEVNVNADWNATSGDAEILNKPSLFSGNYNDLTNKPTIPAAYNDTALSNRVTALENAGFLTTETDPTVPAWAKASSKPTYTASEVGALPSTTVIPTVPTNVSEFNNDAGYLTSFTETDPTVPSWAKASTKPTYTASEVGALPDTTVIPTATSQLTNDSGFLTSHQDISGKQDVLTAGNGIAIDNNDVVRTTGIPFGRCDNTSTSTAFTATVPGIYKLEDGVCCMVKNGVVTSAKNFTININGLGAKPCYTNLAAATRDTTIFNINYTMMFVYDETRVSGGCWICYRGYDSDSNTNTIGYQLRCNSSVMATTDTSRYYKLFFTSADGTQWVPASVNSANNANTVRPVNQRPIDPFGRIMYTSANTNYTAGTNIAVATLWSQYPLSLGYSFNTNGGDLALTISAPVYVKCAPQTNGSAIIDSTTPYVQALPSTNDGKIYIFLGVAYSATNIELYNNHPVYYHDGTGIRLWTGSTGSSTDLSNYYTKSEIDTKIGNIETLLASI